MRVVVTVLGTMLVVLGAACSPASQNPIPLVGGPGDLAALAGEWEGSYWSPSTGRSGSISFTLSAARDSAYGDVVMIPRGFGRPLQAWDRTPAAGGQQPRSQVLTINFVRVAAGRVSGILAPYADPETGVQLVTTFEGRLKGDTIVGTYAAHPAGSTEIQTGEWQVTRRKG